jgi:hypothetical protein
MCCDHHYIYVREQRELDVSLGESYLHVRPFGSHDRTFDCYVINLAIVLSSLALVLETQVGTSDDSVYSSKGWETSDLLGGFLIMRWRWVLRLYLWLGCLGACGEIRYLQRYRRISDCRLRCVDLAYLRCVIVWLVVL